MPNVHIRKQSPARYSCPFVATLALAGLIVLGSLSTVRAGKFAGEFFSLGVGARALALGGAVAAGPFDATAAYWNPAGMNFLPRRSLAAMHSETFGSILNQEFVAYVSPRKGDGFIRSVGVFGYYLGGDDIKLTALDGSGRAVVTSEVSHGDFVLGLSAGARKGRFNFGLTLRPIYRDLGVRNGYGGSIDFGVIYQHDSRLRLALAIKDITSGFVSFTDGSTETISPTVTPGLLYVRQYDEFTLRALASADIRFEGRGRSAQYDTGDLSLDSHYGLEVSYRETLFGRVGSDVGDLTVGAGVAAESFTFDFALLFHESLDDSYRVSVGWSF
jgi:hypothetical protein